MNIDDSDESTESIGTEDENSNFDDVSAEENNLSANDGNKKHIGFLKRIAGFIVNTFMKLGLTCIKCAVKVMLAVLKIASLIIYAIKDVLQSIWHLIKIVFKIIIDPFRKRMKFSEELRQSLIGARKKQGIASLWAAFKAVFIYFFREDGMFYTAFNYVVPILSAAFLVAVIKYGSGLEYGICVEYNGKEVGIISEESDLDAASKEVQQRISYVNDEQEVDFSPKMSLKIVSDNEQYINAAQLANKMLSESNRKLKDAYGIYVNGKFIGAVQDKTPVENALTDVLVNYKADGNARDISFKDKVEYKKGIYLQDSVIAEDKAIATLTATTQKDTSYVVQKDDSPVIICQKFNMELDQFYAKNPSAKTSCTPGMTVTVVETQSYLPIQYTREIETVTFIDYSSIQVETSSLNVGTTERLVRGEKGERHNQVEVTYVDGIEHTRVTLSSKITKQPVIEQIGIGTYTAKPASESTQLFGNGQYGWPVDGGYISDPFISDRNHKGMDIAAPAGTDIYAAADGVIVAAGWNTGGYGNFVMIDHLDGYETIYGHCSAVFVTSGQTVTRGQLIAAVGTTGDSTGNHCHFEVRYLGMCVDPAKFINTVNPLGDAKTEDTTKATGSN